MFVGCCCCCCCCWLFVVCCLLFVVCCFFGHVQSAYQESISKRSCSAFSICYHNKQMNQQSVCKTLLFVRLVFVNILYHHSINTWMYCISFLLHCPFFRSLKSIAFLDTGYNLTSPSVRQSCRSILSNRFVPTVHAFQLIR